MGKGQFSASGDFQLRRIVSRNPPRSHFRASEEWRKGRIEKKREKGGKSERQKQRERGRERENSIVARIRRLTMKKGARDTVDRCVCAMHTRVRLEVG